MTLYFYGVTSVKVSNGDQVPNLEAPRLRQGQGG